MPTATDPRKLPLPPDLRDMLRAARGLENYKLNCANPRFPALSFAYAINAGGEHTIYCDFTEDFVYEYLLRPYGLQRADAAYGPATRNKLPEYARPLWDSLTAINVRSEGGTKFTEATAEEIKTLTDAIYHELVNDAGPAPKW